MEIGKLNRKIVFLENGIKTDEFGNHISNPIEAYSCRAYVKVNSSSENTDNGTAKNTNSLQFTVRQCSFLLGLNTTTHKIGFDGHIYNIQSVKRDFNRNDYITITAEDNERGGSDDESFR